MMISAICNHRLNPKWPFHVDETIIKTKLDEFSWFKSSFVAAVIVSDGWNHAVLLAQLFQLRKPTEDHQKPDRCVCVMSLLFNCLLWCVEQLITMRTTIINTNIFCVYRLLMVVICVTVICQSLCLVSSDWSLNWLNVCSLMQSL